MADYLITVYETTTRTATVHLSLDGEREDAEKAAIAYAKDDPSMWSRPTLDYWGDVEDVTPRPEGYYSIAELQKRARIRIDSVAVQIRRHRELGTYTRAEAEATNNQGGWAIAHLAVPGGRVVDKGVPLSPDELDQAWEMADRWIREGVE